MRNNLFLLTLRFFRRGLAQRCPEPQMKTLVSLGGQHQGVYGLPTCNALNSKFCNKIRPVISDLAYLRFVFQLTISNSISNEYVNLV